MKSTPTRSIMGPVTSKMGTRIGPSTLRYDRTLFRKDVLSLRGTYIRENSNLAASAQ